MEQVFMNIISNASDAIYEKLDSVGGSFKGEMKISFLEENEYLRIDFEDNGFGVPLQERERIKEEFYTTKKFGKGTGLGLSISLRILQQHNSELEIGDSESLGGAKFSIKFPYKNQ
jgi:histidine kinase